jgi:hypothetical protein
MQEPESGLHLIITIQGVCNTLAYPVDYKHCQAFFKAAVAYLIK